jgi:hypothetical protein
MKSQEFVSMNSPPNKSIGIFALVELLAATRTVPFHSPSRELDEVNTFHMKPLASLALYFWSAPVSFSTRELLTFSSSSQQIISP